MKKADRRFERVRLDSVLVVNAAALVRYESVLVALDASEASSRRLNSLKRRP
jgi:hypothetical protein